MTETLPQSNYKVKKKTQNIRQLDNIIKQAYMVYVKIRNLGLGIVFPKFTSLRVHIFVFLSLVWQLWGVRETENLPREQS